MLMHTSYPTRHTTLASPRMPERPQGYELVDLFQHWDDLQPAWDQFVEEHPKGSVFHTSEMLRVYQATKGYRPLALAALGSDGQIAALLTAVRVQTLPGPLGGLSSRSIYYAEPLCADTPASIDALTQLIEQHDAMMSRSVLFTEVRPIFAPGPERAALERCGYEYMEYLNYIVDVTRPIETLWSELHNSAQRAVRQCERRGIKVREVQPETAIDEFYPLLKMSFAHSGVPLADRSMFDASVGELVSSGKIKFFAAYDTDVAMAMDSVLTFKGRVYLWYAGLRRSVGSPCTYLRWHVMQWAHDNGYQLCDSGGAGWPNIPYGVRDFKRKFGGELVQYGRYRKVYAPWKLAIAERAYRLRRSMLSNK